MNRYKTRRHTVANDNVDRWLVSYADYMTLLFALFVVLYAMAMINEKPFETVTVSISNVFQVNETLAENNGDVSNISTEKSSKTNNKLSENSLLSLLGAKNLEGEQVLSNVAVSHVGQSLAILENELQNALYELVESDFAKLQINGDWLEIELKSGLLFPSGSSSVTRTAKSVLSIIYDILGTVNNFVRIRGYTDNEPINNEIFSDNWELSVFRATAILHLLEKLTLNPARMAIEGYGEFYPSADNKTANGRAKNRKVVIAISKYGLHNNNLAESSTISVKGVDNITAISNEDGKDNVIKTIELDNGGILITTRKTKK